MEKFRNRNVTLCFPEGVVWIECPSFGKKLTLFPPNFMFKNILLPIFAGHILN